MKNILEKYLCAKGNHSDLCLFNVMAVRVAHNYYYHPRLVKNEHF